MQYRRHVCRYLGFRQNRGIGGGPIRVIIEISRKKDEKRVVVREGEDKRRLVGSSVAQKRQCLGVPCEYGVLDRESFKAQCRDGWVGVPLQFGNLRDNLLRSKVSLEKIRLREEGLKLTGD